MIREASLRRGRVSRESRHWPRCRRPLELDRLEDRVPLAGGPSVYTVDLTTDVGTGAGNSDDIALLVSSASANNLIGTGGSGGLTGGANGNLVGIANPGLGALGNNGGSMPTIAPMPGSPAIDKGSNALAIDPSTGSALTTDQRGAGFARISNGTVDIGAFKVQKPTSGGGTPTPTPTGTTPKPSVVGVSVDWGAAGASALQTAADGVRLLPAGRGTDLPWAGITRIVVTLSQPGTLTAADVTVTGLGGSYGPVTVTGSGTSYTITLARPIAAADRVTITIGADVAALTRRLDVLPVGHRKHRRHHRSS